MSKVRFFVGKDGTQHGFCAPCADERRKGRFFRVKVHDRSVFPRRRTDAERAQGAVTTCDGCRKK